MRNIILGLLIYMFSPLAHAQLTITPATEGYLMQAVSTDLVWYSEVVFPTPENNTSTLSVVSPEVDTKLPVTISGSVSGSTTTRRINWHFTVEATGQSSMSIRDRIGGSTAVVDGDLFGWVDPSQEVIFAPFAIGGSSGYASMWNIKVTSGGVEVPISGTFTSHFDGSSDEVTAFSIDPGWSYPLDIEGWTETTVTTGETDHIRSVGVYGVVPEPGSGALLLLGGLSVLARRRR